MKSESNDSNGSNLDFNQILSSIQDIAETMKESRKDIIRNFGKNVAEISEGAHVSKGPDNRNAMLKADWCQYEHTRHTIDKGLIQVNFRMPFEINTIKFLLWDNDDRHYGFRIEISADGRTWKTIGDDPFDNRSSWQTITFDDRIVKHARLFGTSSSASENFDVKFMAFYDYHL